MPYRDKRASRAEAVAWLVGAPVVVFLVLQHPELLDKRNPWSLPLVLGLAVAAALVYAALRFIFGVSDDEDAPGQD